MVFNAPGSGAREMTWEMLCLEDRILFSFPFPHITVSLRAERENVYKWGRCLECEKDEETSESDGYENNKNEHIIKDKHGRELWVCGEVQNSFVTYRRKQKQK